jgi:hypothetical protein
MMLEGEIRDNCTRFGVGFVPALEGAADGLKLLRASLRPGAPPASIMRSRVEIQRKSNFGNLACGSAPESLLTSARISDPKIAPRGTFLADIFRVSAVQMPLFAPPKRICEWKLRPHLAAKAKLFHVEQFRVNGNGLGELCCKWICFL